MKLPITIALLLLTSPALAFDLTITIPNTKVTTAAACLAAHKERINSTTMTKEQYAKRLLYEACQKELAWKASRDTEVTAGESWNVCGDGFLDDTEVCDDGDTVGGDGCNATCRSNETCGNAYVDLTESCDDGNTVNGDGCENNCTLTPTTTTTTTLP